MNPDRSFCCSNCTMTFKLSWHLKNQENTFKGVKIMLRNVSYVIRNSQPNLIIQDTKNMFSKERIPI